MTLTITLDELLGWTAEERAKWRPWFKANPSALDLEMQPGGRFPTVASLVDHIFLVEVRHTLRLQNKELPTASGIPMADVDALWAYAERGRQVSPRKLLFHMALHEVRHWAQIASTVRAAGFTPPGDHDLFYSKALI